MKMVSLLLCVAMAMNWIMPVAHAAAPGENLVHEETVVFNGKEYTYNIYENGDYSISTLDENGQIYSLVLDSEGNGTFAGKGHETLILDVEELSKENVDVSILDGSASFYSVNPESYHISSFEQLSTLASGKINTREVITVSVLSAATLLYVLVTLVLAVVVLGVSYVALSSVVDNIRVAAQEALQRRRYFYYKAYVDSGLTDVYIHFIAGGIPLTEAVDRIYAGNSIYTFYGLNAQEAVRLTGLGYIGPEIDANKKDSVLYYFHYHTGTRNGAHAWYGIPRTK